MPKPILALAAILLASAAFAHDGVKNSAVMARMNNMSAISDEMKTLGQMAKGAIAFDTGKAQAAAASIAKHASETNALFEAPEDDPKSEAKPEIWTSFADFSAKSDTLEKLALELSTGLGTESDLASALKTLGAACQACHKTYRE